MSFLLSLSEYNTRAAEAITEAALLGSWEKVNLWSGLKSTANDETLTTEVRLLALTALINDARLLDFEIGPVFPGVVAYRATQEYTGYHNDLQGLNDGSIYLHATSAEKALWNSKASVSDITWLNLQGLPTDNSDFNSAIAGKQNALSGPGSLSFVKIIGNTISYDTNSYLSNINGIIAGGDLSGTFPSPTILSTTILNKVMTGFNGSAATGTILPTDTILTAFEKLNANIGAVSAASGTVTSVSLNLPTTVFTGPIGPYTTAAALNLSFISQSQSHVFAAPSASAGTPSFRALVNADLPTVAGLTPGSYALATVTVNSKGIVTGVASGSVVGTGTVTSVGISAPPQFTVGSPITTSGNLTFAWASNPTPNLVFATPASGSGAPLFRALVAADIPSGIPQANITGLTDALNNKLNRSLNDGEVWIGNSASAPTARSLTQDILITNAGVVTIQPNVVDFSKMQQISSSNLLGRWSAGTGDIEQISLSAQFTVAGGVLDLTSPVTPVLNAKGSLITYRQSIGQQVQFLAGTDGQILIPNSTLDDGLEWVSVSGDISLDTVTPSGSMTINNNVVSLQKLAQVTGPTILGLDTAGLNDVKELTGAEAATIIPTFSTLTTDKGLVVGSNGLGATYYLDATGTWSQPSGTITNALTNGTGILTFSFNGATAGVTVGIDNTVVATLTDTQSLTNKTLSTGTVIDVATPDKGTIWYSSDASGTVAPLAATGSGGKYLSINSTSGLPEWTGVTASTANNISGGAANQILYQTGASTTSFITAPTTANRYLKWDGTGFIWDTAGSGSGTVNAGAQYALAYYPNASGGTVVDDVTISTTNGTNFLTQVITSGSASAMPAWVVAQTAMNTLAGATTSGQYLRGNGTNVVMSAIQAGDVPTLNQNTTGSAASLTTARDIQTNLASTSAASFNGTANITPGVTGTLPVGNGGTGASSLTAYSVLCGGTTSTGAIQSVVSAGTAGQVLTSNGPTALPTFQTAGSGSGTVNSGTLGAIAYYASTGTAVSGTTNLYIDNTNGRINIGTFTAPSARVQLSAGTASVPQMILTPSTLSGVLTNTTDGAIWYDTTSNNSSLYLYKLYGSGTSVLTKIITKDRNPDLATGSTSGVIVSDTSGTLSKSADLTALGIFAASDTTSISNTATSATTMVSTSLVGSKTLPANFFGVGKTIEFKTSGTFTLSSSTTTGLTFRISLGGTLNIDVVLNHNNTISAQYFEFVCQVTCSAISGTNSTYTYSAKAIGQTNTTGANLVYGTAAKSASVAINTGATIATDIQAFFGSNVPGNAISVQQATAIYLN